MRSSAGVGITPPNVLGAPKPQSSVMMSRTLGAPFGGTTRGAHHGFDSDAFSLISPPNAAGGGGICLPSIVVVAPGEPGVPVSSCAIETEASDMHRRMLVDERKPAILLTVRSCCGRFFDALRPSPA